MRLKEFLTFSNYFVLIMETKEATKTIESLITAGKHFKIGKSASDKQVTKKRYVPDEYSNWEVVFSSADKSIADKLEKSLIKKFIKNYPRECDNKQIGAGSSGATYVYLAFD